jgi:hypothetical protein
MKCKQTIVIVENQTMQTKIETTYLFQVNLAPVLATFLMPSLVGHPPFHLSQILGDPAVPLLLEDQVCLEHYQDQLHHAQSLLRLSQSKFTF